MRSSSLLFDNCREQWPKGVCGFANVCGYISTTIWFAVLAPQIWKNWKRRSVEGLSILWASANFTSSLVNCFFVFSVRVPLYLRISAIYMPILEFMVLLQFWFYSKHPVQRKVFYGGGCFLIWCALISLELFVDGATAKVQWLAIVLWSIESFPQVTLNMQLRSTDGQATLSVLLGLIGKTTDFLANYLLLLPLQYVVMTYFSSSLVYINGIQVVWYPKQQPTKSTFIRTVYGSHSSPNEDAIEANDCEQSLIVADPESSVETVDRGSVEEMASVCTLVTPNFDSRARFQALPKYQLAFIGYLSIALTAFAVLICVNTRSWWAIFAPFAVAGVLFGAFLHRNHREGRLGYADRLLAWLGSCCEVHPVQST